MSQQEITRQENGRHQKPNSGGEAGKTDKHTWQRRHVSAERRFSLWRHADSSLHHVFDDIFSSTAHTSAKGKSTAHARACVYVSVCKCVRVCVHVHVCRVGIVCV